MSKVLKANVWVRQAEVSRNPIDQCSYYTDSEITDGVKYYKATITVDIPEKKVEITESQLKSAYYTTDSLIGLIEELGLSNES